MSTIGTILQPFHRCLIVLVPFCSHSTGVTLCLLLVPFYSHSTGVTLCLLLVPFYSHPFHRCHTMSTISTILQPSIPPVSHYVYYWYHFTAIHSTGGNWDFQVWTGELCWSTDLPPTRPCWQQLMSSNNAEMLELTSVVLPAPSPYLASYASNNNIYYRDDVDVPVERWSDRNEWRSSRCQFVPHLSHHWSQTWRRTTAHPAAAETVGHYSHRQWHQHRPADETASTDENGRWRESRPGQCWRNVESTAATEGQLAAQWNAHSSAPCLHSPLLHTGETRWVYILTHHTGEFIPGYPLFFGFRIQKLSRTFARTFQGPS